MELKKVKLTNKYLPDEIWGIIIEYVDMNTLYLLFSKYKFIYRIIFQNKYHLKKLIRNFDPEPIYFKIKDPSIMELKKTYRKYLECKRNITLNGYTLFGKLKRYTGSTKKWKELTEKEKAKYTKKAKYFNFMRMPYCYVYKYPKKSWCNIL